MQSMQFFFSFSDFEVFTENEPYEEFDYFSVYKMFDEFNNIPLFVEFRSASVLDGVLKIIYDDSDLDDGTPIFYANRFDDCEVSLNQDTHEARMVLIKKNCRIEICYSPRLPKDFGREQILYEEFERFYKFIKKIN